MALLTKSWTIGILIGVGLTLIAWDVYVFIEPTAGDTISEVLLGSAPIVHFAFGVVCGHLFWPQRKKE